MMIRLSHGSNMAISYMLREASEITGESELDLMSRKPTAADNLVRVPIDPKAKQLMEEGDIEGVLERVAIL
ncbi:hypothetical protein QBC42DRAFT_273851 [Cladorrhinum samala]|uniref:Uncharacterized protein n=1 Tax=Cladorrhinum samala TaxID=585594 RepID=A0AAV9HJA3_9PEZI|nr:hypothetical protein QBC42DRAFT_273851 [Cladorrhinum samala]